MFIELAPVIANGNNLCPMGHDCVATGCTLPDHLPAGGREMQLAAFPRSFNFVTLWPW
jgi:hypothetical protein